MKKILQGMIAGVLIGAVLTSGVVFSKQISETAELFYNNIKIYIDGGEMIPKDANGNVYKGTLLEHILIQNLTEYADALKAKDLALLQALLKDGREKKATAGGN